MEDRLPLIIGSDHAAYDLKENIKDFLVEKKIEVKDIGVYGAGSSDYPDYAFMVAQAVSSGEYSRGILLCGTGIGMSMAANRFANVRAALCNDLFSAIMSRRHNNSNILVLGGRLVGDILAREIVSAWLETPFEGGRHNMRLEKFQGIGYRLR